LKLLLSLEKKDQHFCTSVGLNVHFTKGGSLQNQAEEQITYQLCHMYSRANKSVGYATPAYMADHACHWDARVIFFCVDQLLLILLLKPRYGPFKSFKMQHDLLKALFYISVFRGV
jgi:hypothetical protein